MYFKAIPDLFKDFSEKLHTDIVCSLRQSGQTGILEDLMGTLLLRILTLGVGLSEKSFHFRPVRD